MSEPDDGARRQTLTRAMTDALWEEMERDERIIVLGEDVEAGTFGLTSGFLEHFGPRRIRNTPISEAGFVGAAIGAAMSGLRPFVDLTISTFSYLALDQIVNQAAKNRFLFGAQVDVPIVLHLANYHRSLAAAQHTDRPHPLFMNVPGLKIVHPSNPADSKGLLRSALRDDDPVLFFTDMTVNTRRGDVPADDFVVPIGSASIVRPGRDLTIVALFTVREALAAADILAADGVDAEVIDPRSLAPLDASTILESVSRTGRLVVADTAHRTCSAASEVAAIVAESGFGALRAPIARVTTPNLHVPHSPPLEALMFPTAERIAEAAGRVYHWTPEDD